MVRRKGDVVEGDVLGELTDDAHAMQKLKLYVLPDNVLAPSREDAGIVAKRIANLINAPERHVMFAATTQ